MQDLIFGIHAVMEAVKAGKELERVFVKKGLVGELSKELEQLLRKNRIAFQFVPIEKLNRLTRKNHQGVVAYISQVEYQSLEGLIPLLFEAGETPLVLVLDRVSDVRNFGAIARSAECAGVHAIVVPEKGAALINADAIKTSAGALHKIDVCRVPVLTDAIKFLSDSGFKIVAASEKADSYHYNIDFTGPTAIIMGAEDNGISADLLEEADEIAKIPIFGEIGSLNVSVAASVLLYEAVRQRLP